MPKFQMVSAGGNLQGMVPPSEDAGKQFQMDMLDDAIRYHEEGDETDAPCCTGDDPCETRIFLIGRQRDLAGQTVADRETARAEYNAETPQPTPRTGSAGQTSGPGAVADPASPKQIAYITSLAEQHDVSQIGTFPRRTLTQIQEGNEVSKGRASRLIEVLLRQPKISAEIRPEGPAATPAQMSFIRTLCDEQGEEVRTSYTKSEASAEIERLLTARTAAPARTSGRISEDGMYRTPSGDIYKVQIAKNGSGRLYAKKLTQHEDGWSFEYAAGAMKTLTPDMKMTLADAQEFGRMYGVCCRCGADLTDETSIADGIGPICAGKM